MCRVGRFLVAFAIFIIGWYPVTTLAGARIDLRPAPPPNGAEYQVGDVFNVDVFMVDTGNPQGDINFRGLFLDFADSEGFSYPGMDATSGTQDDNQFRWVSPFDICACFPNLPGTSMVFPDVGPPWLPRLPDGGELLLGYLNVRLETVPATLDVMNDDEPDPTFGARADFGFGGLNDPVTTWRAYTGDITGGVHVIPEPASLALLTLTAAGTFMRIRSRS